MVLTLQEYLLPQNRLAVPDDNIKDKLKDFIARMVDKCPKKLRVFDAILFYINCYGAKTSPSQETIAKKAGCGVWWVNQVLAELADAGWIVMKYRHRHTSMYKLNRVFRDVSVRWLLKEFLSSLKWTHIYKIGSVMVSSLGRKKHPRPISKEIYINKKYIQNYKKRDELSLSSEKVDPNYTRNLMDIALQKQREKNQVEKQWDDVRLSELPLAERISLLEKIYKQHPQEDRRRCIELHKRSLAREQHTMSFIY